MPAEVADALEVSVALWNLQTRPVVLDAHEGDDLVVGTFDKELQKRVLIARPDGAERRQAVVHDSTVEIELLAQALRQ